MKRPWRRGSWILVGICAALHAGGCHDKPAEQTTEALPASAAVPLPSAVVSDRTAVAEELPNASLDPGANNRARPLSELAAEDESLPLEPVMTPKHKRRPKRRPLRLEATLVEGFCYDMYSVCSRGELGRCTSAPYHLNCGVTGQLPTGDWATCVCK
jgi:hypothetical protein